MRIERLPARAGRRSGASAYKDLVWAVATADDRSEGVERQATQAFTKIDALLQELGSASDRIITVAVYLADIGRKAELDLAWDRWVPQDSSRWPMRSCVQAGLASGVLIEVVVTAVRDLEEN
ncbi:Rid family hydrolase [Ramlibacter sp.]|uniref:Rid family hydrolase n=1 Tax=Ramlibacter sp. TaxID=1917967 RepID=UPI002FC738EF